MTKLPIDETPDLGHILNLDDTTGTEFVAGSIEIFGPDFFVEYAKENPFSKLYHQYEFDETYSKGKYHFARTLCTIYGPITALSNLMGREITLPERLELVTRRAAKPDYVPSSGGFTSVGVDVARIWHNELYPNDKVVSFIVNSDRILAKLASKDIPIVTSLRGNREFSLDTVDGVMDKLNYWNFPGPRYGHCRARRGLRVVDNYLREYRYKTAADLKLCTDKGFESGNVFVYCKESWLSDLGKTYLKATREGYFNGERPNDINIRQDAAAMAFRKGKGLVPLEKLYNQQRKMDGVTLYEFSVMLNKATGGIFPIYTSKDKDRVLTRGECIKILMSF